MLLATQNSRSFSCAPRFDHVTIEKPQKEYGYLYLKSFTYFLTQKN